MDHWMRITDMRIIEWGSQTSGCQSLSIKDFWLLIQPILTCTVTICFSIIKAPYAWPSSCVICDILHSHKFITIVLGKTSWLKIWKNILYTDIKRFLCIFGDDWWSHFDISWFFANLCMQDFMIFGDFSWHFM